MKLAIKVVATVRQPISRRVETKPGTVHTSCTCYFCYNWGQKSCLSKPCSSKRYPLKLGKGFDQTTARAKEGIMASIWEGQSGKDESLLAWRRPLHQWHQSHSSALGCWDQRALRVSLWNIHGGTNAKLSTSSHIQRLFDDSNVVALT